MKYLKYSLLERCRSLDDNVAEAASDEWDQAIAKYNAALAVVRPQFPPAVRTILDRFSLHDAQTLACLLTKKKLSLVIRLEGTSIRPGKMLELNYTLAPAGLHVVNCVDVKHWLKDHGRIQYDEFGKVADAPATVFSHSLLLAEARELRIQFTDLHVRRMKKVILPSAEQAGLGAT